MGRKKELERIENLSKQLGATQELILKFHENLIKVSGVMAQTFEARRRENEKKEKSLRV